MDATNQQYTLDFTSRRNELIALTSSLTRAPLMIGGKVMSQGRVYGVIDLLKRLICLMPAGAPLSGDRVPVIAQVPYLGSRMQSFRCVNERTVRRWSTDAQALGVIEVTVRAHQFGNRNWNEWILRIDRLREVGGHGRTWADTMPALGADTMPALGADTMPAPQIREKQSRKEHGTALHSVTCRDVGFAEARATGHRSQEPSPLTERVQTRDAADVQTRRDNPWSIEVTSSNLVTPAIVRRLHAEVVAKGWWLDGEAGRLSWATLCVYVAREGREPGRLLTTCARSGKHNGTQADEAKARRLVEVAWSGLDSAEAEERLDALTEFEFREWLDEVLPADLVSRQQQDARDNLIVYGRGRGTSTRPRLIRLMAQWLAAEAIAEAVP